MTDTELSGKEAYEARKREKEAQREPASGGLGRGGRRAMKWGITVAILLVLVYLGYLWVRSLAPKTEDMSVPYEIQGWEHVAAGGEQALYNSNPPTSGDHYGEPARPGFRDGEQIADGNLIHSLEHGLVWLSYQPDISPDIVEQLKDFDTGLVVITERPENDFDIAVASWGRLDTFDVGETLDEVEYQRIKDFITRYVNRGREQIPPWQHTGI